MKKIHAINLCVVLIIFLTAGACAKPATDSKEVKRLIGERIETLNSYYCGEENLDDTRQALEKIEKGSMLKQDVALMKAYDRTEIDRIAGYTVKILSCKRTSFGIVKGKAEIRYIMDGQKGKWKETHRYFFTGEKEKSKTKLTQLKIV